MSAAFFYCEEVGKREKNGEKPYTSREEVENFHPASIWFK